MKPINVSAPLVCPRCKGKGQDTQEIERVDRRGRALYLPCRCVACDGRGYISVAYYRKLCKAAKQANRALIEMGLR